MPAETTSPDRNGFTFEVDDVEIGKRPMATYKIHERLSKLVRQRIESCSDYHTDVCCNLGYQPLLAAVYSAYCDHLPLVLNPDAIWLTLAQGVAQHMAVHGESLRRRFVAHDGKLELRVGVLDWIPGSPENPWEDAFEVLTNQIRGHVGAELYQTLICNFSTTDKSSRIASQIVMMDIFETYFKYRWVGICGIPWIELRGTEDDWNQLAQKVRRLRAFDMDWWLDRLEPLVDTLAETRRGNVDLKHWQNICKRTEAYGGDEINGWIAYFFPYLRDPGQDFSCRTRNRIFETGRGFSTLAAPTGLSQVPIVWEHTDGCARLMKAFGGLIGVKQDRATLALEPVAGWAVCEAAQLDALLFEVKQLVPSQRGELAEASATVDELTREIICERLPEDLGRFFYELGDCVELSLAGCALPVVIKFPGAGEVLAWHEKLEEHGNSYGPFGRTWFKIAQLNDSKYLAANLDPNCPERYLNDKTKRWIPFELRAPIAVLSDSSIGYAVGNPVIALSFSELLDKLLHAESKVGYFWEATDFQAYGEAHAITRVHLEC